MSDSSLECMPRGLLDRAGLDNCPTTHSLLTSIAIFNGEVALLSLILGHEHVRRAVSRYTCFPSKRWTPLAGVVTTMISIMAMLAATYLLRNNGFRPDAFMLFGFWTMRPRASTFTLVFFLVARFVFGQRGQRNTYLWSLKDHVVEETLLTAFSLPFALWYCLHRPDSLQVGDCSDDSSYLTFWNSFYVIAAAGCVAAFLLVVMAGHACSADRRSKEGSVYNPVTGTTLASAEPLSRFWVFTFFVSGVTMIVVFVTSWVIWSTFVINAGTDFCPGSVVGEGIAWGVALFINAFIRPILGGPATG